MFSKNGGIGLVNSARADTARSDSDSDRLGGGGNVDWLSVTRFREDKPRSGIEGGGNA